MISPITRPVTPAQDLAVTVFEDVDLSLPELLLFSAARGVPLIQGRTFRRCRLQGPAILLVAEDVTFDGTNFGDPRGDIRNLLLRPEGTRAIGTVPLRTCVFEGCEFHGVGFTGSDAFLNEVRALGGATSEGLQ
ncbi:MAG: hypothetical protein ACK5WW_03960 [Brevundimonas sp.]|jgi:hypothetical protein|uniref:hypothetical protein n=1 Tax=Brevundimonas sp. TaxID=1871086 RepID=UPI00391888A7